MNTTIILNREDVNNPLHPNLWEDFMDTLGLDHETTEVCLDRSKLDDNKVIPEYQFKINNRVTLANNTTIVCGTVRSNGVDSIGDKQCYVEWDDVLWNGCRQDTMIWHNEDELVQI